MLFNGSPCVCNFILSIYISNNNSKSHGVGVKPSKRVYGIGSKNYLAHSLVISSCSPTQKISIAVVYFYPSGRRHIYSSSGLRTFGITFWRNGGVNYNCIHEGLCWFISLISALKCIANVRWMIKISPEKSCRGLSTHRRMFLIIIFQKDGDRRACCNYRR